MYAYVGGDPVGRVDPTGPEGEEPDEIVVQGIKFAHPCGRGTACFENIQSAIRASVVSALRAAVSQAFDGVFGSDDPNKGNNDDERSALSVGKYLNTGGAARLLTGYKGEVGIYVASDGGPNSQNGVDSGILITRGPGFGAGGSVDASVGFFRGTATDMAGNTLDVDVGVPTTAVIGPAVGWSYDTSLASRTPNSVEVGLGAGAGGSFTPNATTTIGMSGVDGRAGTDSDALRCMEG